MSRYTQREIMQMRRQQRRNELADELRRKRFGPKPAKSLKEQIAEYVRDVRKGESFDDEDAWRYTGTGTDMINEVAELLWQHSKKDKSIRVEGDGYIKIAKENTMSRKLTASDRKSLIRLASSLPAGSEDRRAVLSALKKAQTFNPYRTGHKYGINLESVDNKTVKDYSGEAGGITAMSGTFYATGTVTDSSRPGEHPFKAVFSVSEHGPSGTLAFNVDRVYGYSADAQMNAEIAAYVLFDSYAAQGEFHRMLGKLRYVPGSGEPGYRRRH